MSKRQWYVFACANCTISSKTRSKQCMLGNIFLIINSYFKLYGKSIEDLIIALKANVTASKFVLYKNCEDAPLPLIQVRCVL